MDTDGQGYQMFSKGEWLAQRMRSVQPRFRHPTIRGSNAESAAQPEFLEQEEAEGTEINSNMVALWRPLVRAKARTLAPARPLATWVAPLHAAQDGAARRPYHFKRARAGSVTTQLRTLLLMQPEELHRVIQRQGDHALVAAYANRDRQIRPADRRRHCARGLLEHEIRGP